MKKPPIVAVVGPTASGKTAVAIDIAKKFNGEVISADSRQVYRGLDIGTGKVTKEEMAGVPHHLLDVADLHTVYTASDFKRDAAAALIDIRERGRLPILAGGSTFYLNLLRGQQQPAPVPPNPTLRASLEQLTTNDLFAQLQTLDPARAEVIDSENRRRLVRALEIVEALGKVPPTIATDSLYKWLLIGVSVQKEQLLANFEMRLEKWLEAGFESEVRELLASNLSQGRLQELGFEYTLMQRYISGEINRAELVEQFVQKNWQYAKRQMTWLKRDQNINWEKPENRQAIFTLVENFLSEQPG